MITWRSPDDLGVVCLIAVLVVLWAVKLRLGR